MNSVRIKSKIRADVSTCLSFTFLIHWVSTESRKGETMFYRSRNYAILGTCISFFFGGNLSSDFAGKKLFMFISFSCKRCLYSPCHVMRVRLLPCDHHSRVTCWWDAFVLAVKICQLCHQRTLSPSSRKNQKELNKWVAAM